MTCYSPSKGSRVLDYIWTNTGAFRVVGILKTVPADKIRSGLPTTVYPSDHVSLKATVAFTPWYSLSKSWLLGCVSLLWLSFVFSVCQGEDPKSSKFPHDGGVRAVDYIVYTSHSLALLGVHRTAPESDIQQGIPSAVYPSDHVSTKATLGF